MTDDDQARREILAGLALLTMRAATRLRARVPWLAPLADIMEGAAAQTALDLAAERERVAADRAADSPLN